MGKNNKGAKPAPKVETPKTETPAQEKNQQTATPAIQVVQMDNLKGVLDPTNHNLSPDRRVDLIMYLDRKLGDPQSANLQYGFQPEAIQKLDIVLVHAAVATFANEVVNGDSPVAINIQRGWLPQVLEVADSMGIKFGDTKLLTAAKPGEETDEDILQVAGSEAKIATETKKKIKEEAKIANSEIELDPTKLDKEGAVTALKHILITTNGGYEKLAKAIAFLRSWLEIQNKDNKEELEKIKNFSNLELLEMVKKNIGECPFVVNSMGNHMAMQVGSTKSPVFAFCMFRNSAKNKTTYEPTISDQEVADYTKFIVIWSTELKIDKVKASIEQAKNDIAELSKTKEAKKQNAKAITAAEEKIEQLKKNIEHLNETINTVTSPSSDVPDTLIEMYKEHDKNANNMFKMICESYYKGIDISKVAPEDLYNNVQQYAGIITNLFRPATEPLRQYSIANLIELTETEEEKPADEEPKND